MARVTLKVRPRAKRSAITGRLGEAWKRDANAFDVVDTRVAAGVANLKAEVAWRVSR